MRQIDTTEVFTLSDNRPIMLDVSLVRSMLVDRGQAQLAYTDGVLITLHREELPRIINLLTAGRDALRGEAFEAFMPAHQPEHPKPFCPANVHNRPLDDRTKESSAENFPSTLHGILEVCQDLRIQCKTEHYGTDGAASITVYTKSERNPRYWQIRVMGTHCVERMDLWGPEGVAMLRQMLLDAYRDGLKAGLELTRSI